jgi:VIT1/CCC1 family predicted Fe2+/Mn2+ transporter
MMLAAIGCNVAWGLVDGVMYLVSRVTQQMRGLRVLNAVVASGPAEGGRELSAALPPLVVEALGAKGIEELRNRLIELPSRPERVRIPLEDWLGALGIFLIAVVSMMPVLIPFIVMKEPHPAMRVSNAIALLMLFLLGQQWGSLIGLPRWRVGIALALGGAVLVAITIALGG